MRIQKRVHRLLREFVTRNVGNFAAFIHHTSLSHILIAHCYLLSSHSSLLTFYIFLNILFWFEGMDILVFFAGAHKKDGKTERFSD